MTYSSHRHPSMMLQVRTYEILCKIQRDKALEIIKREYNGEVTDETMKACKRSVPMAMLVHIAVVRYLKELEAIEEKRKKERPVGETYPSPPQAPQQKAKTKEHGR